MTGSFGTVSGGGSSLKLVEFCQFCGTRITEQCEICKDSHVIGFEYCPRTGKNRAVFLKEQLENHERYQRRCKEVEEQIAQNKVNEKKLKQDFDDAYRARNVKHGRMVAILSLTILVLYVFGGIIVWKNLHSIIGRVIEVFAICVLWLLSCLVLERRILVLPAKIRAWGSPPWPNDWQKWI